MKYANDIKFISHYTHNTEHGLRYNGFNRYWVPRASDLWSALYKRFCPGPLKMDHNRVIDFNRVAKKYIYGFQGVCVDPYDSRGMSSDVEMIEAMNNEGFYFASKPNQIKKTLWNTVPVSKQTSADLWTNENDLRMDEKLRRQRALHDAPEFLSDLYDFISKAVKSGDDNVSKSVQSKIDSELDKLEE